MVMPMTQSIYQLPNAENSFIASTANDCRHDKYTPINPGKLKVAAVGLSQIAKAFAAATGIVFCGATLIVGLATSKLELHNYYTGPDGRGTVDDISSRLRDGCPSFYKESNYKFYLAVERLERAAATSAKEERENLAREAFNYLSKVPESADLQIVCKRFEDLRFYEAVVRLPLQKAQAVDPAGDASNEHLDAGMQEHALGQREQCYEIITNALRVLKGEEASQREFGSPIRPVAQSVLDPASRKRFICQIIQLGVQSPDQVFHDYLYCTLIDLGLEK